MTPLSQLQHNGTSFAESVGSYLPILLQNILKYFMIQAYVTFKSHYVAFVYVPFSHC